MSHSTTELQDILSEQIDRMVQGEATPASVNAVVNSVSGIVRIYKLQMDYARQVGRKPYIAALITTDPEEAQA